MGVGQATCLVEIVNPPHEATLGVPPRPEVLDVQIANAQNLGGMIEVRVVSIGELIANRRPPLGPAVERCAKELESAAFGQDLSALCPCGARYRDARLKPNAVGISSLVERIWPHR